MRRLTLAAAALALAATAAAQTTTTRTDRLIASTQAIVGGTTLGAHTFDVTGTLGVSGAATLSSTLGVTGNTTLTGDLAVNGGDLTASTSLIVRPAGDLRLDPTGVVVIDADGGVVQPLSNYAQSLGLISKKFLNLYAAELHVDTLVAQDVMATIGGRILVAPTTLLSADLGDGVSDTTITVKHNNLASGDRVYLEGNGAVEFLAVTSGAGGSAGAYTYSVTRDLDGSGRNVWYAGDAVVNTGTTGDGWIDLYSVRGVASGGYGPAICGQERLSATYNDWEPRWCIGNLNGVYGYSADTYGAAFGDDDASNLVIDSTNGIRFRNGTTVLGSWSGSTVTLGQPLTSNNTGQLVIDSDSIELIWRNNSGSNETALRVSNSSGNGTVTLPAYQFETNDLSMRPTGNGNRIMELADGLGNDVSITVGEGTGDAIWYLSTIRPGIDGGGTLGTSSYQWASIYADAYYVGTTAGVSGTCASVTVVNGIVTGCTP